MKTATLVFWMAWAFALPALGGVNAGGCMVVHTNDLYSYTSDTQCSTPYVQDVGDISEVITRTDLATSVLWLLAVFPPASTPRVAGLTCGITYAPNLWVESYWLCGPDGSVEITGPGWPDSDTQTSIAFTPTVAGDRVFPFYGFLVTNDGGPGAFCTDTNGSEFLDDSIPPVSDPVLGPGCVHWYEPGPPSQCAPPQPGACCISTYCFILTQAECNNQGGTFLQDPPCDPSPCPQSSVPESGLADERVVLDLVGPNPIVGAIRYRIELRQPTVVEVRLYDAAGRQVADVLHTDLGAGSHRFDWIPLSGGRLASGVYTLKLDASLSHAEEPRARVPAAGQVPGRQTMVTRRLVAVR